MAVQVSGVAAAAAATAASVAALLTLTPGTAQAQTTTPPPLPPTTPTESHATVDFGVPSDRPGPGTVLPPGAGRPAPAVPGSGASAGTDTRNKLIIDQADSADYQSNSDTGSLVGSVRLRYNEYIVSCERATWNRKQHFITLEGNVVLQTTTDPQIIYAEFVRVNTETNEFLARRASTIVSPEKIGQQIAEPVRLSGETFRREGNLLIATDGLMTTCDFPFPHYKVGFAQATIIPNRRIVLRKAVLYRYDRAVLRLDYLSLPIHDQIRYSYLPVVGEDDQEGYYIKNAIGYTLGNQLPGLLRLDYMTKLGTGLGFDQAYQFGQRAAGIAVLYGIEKGSSGFNNTSGRINHQQRIGDTLATITTNFQNNSLNALTPTSKTQQTTINTTRTGRSSSTALSLTVGNTSEGGYSSVGESSSKNYQYGITQTQQFGADSTVTFRFNGSDASNTSTTTDSSGNATSTTSGTLQQTADIRAQNKGRYFDTDLSANKLLASRRTGASGGSGYYSGTQSLPELNFSSDSARLEKVFLGGFFKSLPMRLTTGFGNYLTTTSTTTESQRALFDAGTNAPAIPLTKGGGLSLTVNGDYRQTAYRADFTPTTSSSGTASNTTLKNQEYEQYVLRSDNALTQRIGKTSSFGLTYNYLRPYGGVPTTFSQDQSGSSNNLGSRLDLIGERVKLSLSTGYDIQEEQRKIANASLGAYAKHNPWQQLVSSLALKPDNVVQTRFDSSYNINNGRLVSATNRTRIRGKNDFAVDLSFVFDPTRKKFSQITDTLSTPIFSRDLRLTVQTGYNDVTHQFLYKDIGLVQSFHDYEYVFTYHDQPIGYQSDKGFNFFIRLKAFPFLQRPATGQFGAALDTSTQSVF